MFRTFSGNYQCKLVISICGTITHIQRKILLSGLQNIGWNEGSRRLNIEVRCSASLIDNTSCLPTKSREKCVRGYVLLITLKTYVHNNRHADLHSLKSQSITGIKNPSVSLSRQRTGVSRLRSTLCKDSRSTGPQHIAHCYVADETCCNG